MLHIKFLFTGRRNILLSSLVILVKKFKYILFLVFLIFMTSCNSKGGVTPKNLVAKTTLAESQPEHLKIKNNLKKENLRQFLLGAIKLCQNEDYQSIIGDKPKYITEIQQNKYCYEFFLGSPANTTNPYETYMYKVMGEKFLFEYRGEPFELKEYRESDQYLKMMKSIKKESQNISLNSLQWYSMADVLVKEYDFKSEELILYMPKNKLFGTKGASVKKVKYTQNTKLSFKEKDAKRLFKLFEETSKYNRGKTLNSVVTYGLATPSNQKSNYLTITPIKIEMFSPDGWDNKIGEIIF